MDQLHLLWEYQKADVEVDKLEASIRRSPVRQKLVKYRVMKKYLSAEGRHPDDQ